MSCLCDSVSRSVRGDLTVLTSLVILRIMLLYRHEGPETGRDAEESLADVDNDPHGLVWSWLMGFGIRPTGVPVPAVQGPDFPDHPHPCCEMDVITHGAACKA